LVVTVFRWNITAVGETITVQPKALAASVFHRDQEVGTALGEEQEKGWFAC
jgi:hypothetical protein